MAIFGDFFIVLNSHLGLAFLGGGEHLSPTMPSSHRTEGGAPGYRSASVDTSSRDSPISSAALGYD